MSFPDVFTAELGSPQALLGAVQLATYADEGIDLEPIDLELEIWTTTATGLADLAPIDLEIELPATSTIHAVDSHPLGLELELHPFAADRITDLAPIALEIELLRTSFAEIPTGPLCAIVGQASTGFAAGLVDAGPTAPKPNPGKNRPITAGQVFSGMTAGQVDCHTD